MDLLDSLDGFLMVAGLTARHSLSLAGGHAGVSIIRCMHSTTEMYYEDIFPGHAQFSDLKFEDDSTIGFLHLYIPQTGYVRKDLLLLRRFQKAVLDCFARIVRKYTYLCVLGDLNGRWFYDGMRLRSGDAKVNEEFIRELISMGNLINLHIPAPATHFQPISAAGVSRISIVKSCGPPSLPRAPPTDWHSLWR